MKIETGMLIGILYTAIMVPSVTYLLYSGKMKRELGWTISIISVLMGFAYFAPMFPWQLQSLMLGKIPQPNLPMVMIVSTVVILSSLLVGRVFCGYVCPPGAIQELAYLAPIKKIRLSSSITIKVRWVIFVIILATSVVLSFNLTKMLGLQDLFTLTLTPALIIFLAIILASTVIYRPFCRLFCPFGALSSLFSGYGLLGVRRKEGCVDCGKCSKVCPPQVLNERAGAECYLCGRCMESCHKGALRYSKGVGKK